MRTGILIGAALLAAVPTAHLAAHHSFSMFDPAKPMSFPATVKAFQWASPHAILWVDAEKVGDYAAGTWSLELPTSPGNLSKMGWSRSSVKPGERIIVDINPMRDGRRSGQFKKLTFVETGKSLAASPVLGTAPK